MPALKLVRKEVPTLHAGKRGDRRRWPANFGRDRNAIILACEGKKLKVQEVES